MSEIQDPVNIISITLTHRPKSNGIAVTAASLYIEDSSDKAIVALRNLIMKYVEQITAPVPEGTTHPVWGEAFDAPGEAPSQDVRVPEHKIITNSRGS